MKLIATIALSAALAGGAALAQPAQHGQMAKQDYMKAMQDMHQKMMAADDADPDRAFALKMIQHHQGGIAMGQVLQQHGDDAELKQMAQQSADMQRKEIAELQAWLDRHGGRAPRK
jgi:uncharacterized protein (DUF305 family)